MAKRNKNFKVPLIIMSIVIVIGLSALFFFNIKSWIFPTQNNMIHAVFYRGNQVVSGTELTTIGSQTGITGVQFVVMVKNTGNINLITYIDTATPSGTSFATAFDTGKYVLVPNQSINFTTPILPTVPFESLQQPATFSVRVRQDFSCPLGNKCAEPNGSFVNPGQNDTFYLAGSLSFNMQPDVVGVSSSISFVSTNGTSTSGVTNTTNTTTTTTTIPTTTTVPTSVTLYSVSSGCDLIYGLACPATGYSSCNATLTSVPCTNCNCPITVSLLPGRYYKSTTACGYNSLTSIGCTLIGNP